MTLTISGLRSIGLRRRSIGRFVGFFGLLLSALGSVAPAAAQTPAAPRRAEYTPLDAGRDAYVLGNARRLGQVNWQLNLNQRMRWLSWPGYSGGFFEPWPFVPGDIWGYPIYMTTRQSVGQRQYQAGPNRWISEPVYLENLAPPLGAAPLAPHAAAALGNAGLPLVATGSPLNAGQPANAAPPLGAAAGLQNQAPGPPPGFEPAPEEVPRPYVPSGPREF